MSDSLHFKPDFYRATLRSVGDAVITTDVEGRVTFLNPVAESLTGWTLDEATGLPLQNVVKIVNLETGQTLESPTVRALLDICLPKLNGYEVCRCIREQPWGKGVVLIAVTGWGQDEDRHRSHEAGFDHHMVKR